MSDKIPYLYEYEKHVRTIAPAITGSLAEGMWCNAHMYHGMGLDCELAAVKFITECVAKWHPHLIADRQLAIDLHGANHGKLRFKIPRE